MKTIRVAASSRPRDTAGAIAGIIRENQVADVRAIGMVAVNQTVKAIAMAAGFLDREGMPIATVPRMEEIDLDGKETTAIFFRVFVLDAQG